MSAVSAKLPELMTMWQLEAMLSQSIIVIPDPAMWDLRSYLNLHASTDNFGVGPESLIGSSDQVRNSAANGSAETGMLKATER